MVGVLVGSALFLELLVLVDLEFGLGGGVVIVRKKKEIDSVSMYAGCLVLSKKVKPVP
jgi:hypothetical protein